MKVIGAIFTSSYIGVKSFVFWIPLRSNVDCPVSAKPLRKETFNAGNPAIELRTLTRPRCYGGRNADEKKNVEMRAQINFAVLLYGQVFERWCFNHLIGIVYLFFEFFCEKRTYSVSLFNVTSETLEHIRNVLIVRVSKAIEAIANAIHAWYMFVVISQGEEKRNGAGTLNHRTYAICILLGGNTLTTFTARHFDIGRHAIVKIVVTLGRVTTCIWIFDYGRAFTHIKHGKWQLGEIRNDE